MSSPARVRQIYPTPLNCEAQFRMTLGESSEVVNFYLTYVGDPRIELEYDYPDEHIVKESATSYLFTAPRLKQSGLWYLEWLTDFGASEENRIKFRVKTVISSLLLDDIDNWVDPTPPPSTGTGVLPATLPMLI